ncbi:MAG: hypothetical protein QNK05_00895 [Myxococcota bacterium]|nr:hypothetical protein [Myxococcota bacterium]
MAVRRPGLVALAMALGLSLPLAAGAQPHLVTLEVTARFRDAAFARAPYLDGLAQLRFDEEQPWAQEWPAPMQLEVDGDRVTGSVSVAGEGPPPAGATLGFRLAGHRFDVSLDGLGFERGANAPAGAPLRARLPLVLQVDDPSWVAFHAELLEVQGLRPRLRIHVENQGSAPFPLDAVAIRAERRPPRVAEGDCLEVPDAELPKVHWNWQGAATDATGAARREEDTRLSTVRVGGCALRWMSTSVPVAREIEPGGRLRLLLTPLPRAAASPALGGARVDQLSGWDALRLSLSGGDGGVGEGKVWPTEAVLRPAGR